MVCGFLFFAVFSSVIYARGIKTYVLARNHPNSKDLSAQAQIHLSQAPLVELKKKDQPLEKSSQTAIELPTQSTQEEVFPREVE